MTSKMKPSKQLCSLMSAACNLTTLGLCSCTRRILLLAGNAANQTSSRAAIRASNSYCCVPICKTSVEINKMCSYPRIAVVCCKYASVCALWRQMSHLGCSCPAWLQSICSCRFEASGMTIAPYQDKQYDTDEWLWIGAHCVQTTWTCGNTVKQQLQTQQQQQPQ